MRTVRAEGWPYEYRAYVSPYEGWFRKGWKFHVEQKWVHWRHYSTSWRVYKTKEAAQAAANARLDSLEVNWDKEFVEEA